MSITTPISVTESTAISAQKKTDINSENWKNILETQNSNSNVDDLSLDQVVTEETTNGSPKSTQSLHHATLNVSLKQGITSQEGNPKNTQNPITNHPDQANKKPEVKKTHSETTEQNQSITFCPTPPCAESACQNAVQHENEQNTIGSKNTLADSVHSSNNDPTHSDDNKIDSTSSVSKNQKHSKEDIEILSNENIAKSQQDKTSSIDQEQAAESNNNTQSGPSYKSSNESITTSNIHDKLKILQKNTNSDQSISKNSKIEIQKIDSNSSVESAITEKETRSDLKKNDFNHDKVIAISSANNSTDTFKINLPEINSQTNSSINMSGISLAPSALSAAVVALHKSGQNGILLRLDPPNLGHLSIQIKMNPEGSINVFFTPSSTDAAHILFSSLPQLNAALVQSGISLGQTQIGGQFSQSGGQHNRQNTNTSPRQFLTNTLEDNTLSSSYSKGLSFYA